MGKTLNPSVPWSKHSRSQQRRIDAMERQKEHDKLSVKEKIAKAKTRRGVSMKEIVKLGRTET